MQRLNALAATCRNLLRYLIVIEQYIVNGNWMTNPEEQTETDAAGNTNNVFTSEWDFVS